MARPPPSATRLSPPEVWGLLLLVPLLHGPGRLSVDHFPRRRFIDTGAPYWATPY